MKFTIPLEPMGKPRMTHQGRFGPKAKAFYRWKEAFRLHVPDGLTPDEFQKGVFGIAIGVSSVSWTAYFSIPPSYSKKKAAALAGKPHRVKPDRDNVDKAILDSMLENDAIVADGTLRKRWDDGRGARIELEVD